VTTEKDLARLRGSEGAEDIMPFPVTLEFDDVAGLAEIRVGAGCFKRARRNSEKNT